MTVDPRIDAHPGMPRFVAVLMIKIATRHKEEMQIAMTEAIRSLIAIISINAAKAPMP